MTNGREPMPGLGIGAVYSSLLTSPRSVPHTDRGFYLTPAERSALMWVRIFALITCLVRSWSGAGRAFHWSACRNYTGAQGFECLPTLKAAKTVESGRGVRRAPITSMDDAKILQACRLLHDALYDDLELRRFAVTIERDRVSLTIHLKRGG
jgi:hypothetical protein